MNPFFERLLRAWYTLTSRRRLYEFDLKARCAEPVSEADAQTRLGWKLALLERARYKKDDSAELRALVDIAILQYELKQFHAALQYIQEGFQSARKCKLMDLPLAASLYNVRGCVLQLQADYSAALECFRAAAAILGKWSFIPASADILALEQVVRQNIENLREWD